MPYRSCRELARRVLTVGDALVSVEPPALATEIREHAAELMSRLAAPK